MRARLAAGPRRGRGRRLAVGAALGLLALGPTARSEEAARPTVTLAVEGCLDLAVEGVARQLRIELQAPVTLAPAAGPPASTHVRVLCVGGAHRLEVTDRLTNKALARDLDLQGAAPRVRARLLALSIAEFVTLSWMELAAFPRTSAAPPAGPPAPREAVAAARAFARARLPEREEPTLRHDAFADDRAFFRGTGPLYGGGARLLRHRGGLGLRLDLEGAVGGEAVPLGRSSATIVSAGLAVEARLPLGAGGVAAALGLRGGGARLVGATDGPGLVTGTVSGPFGGPFLALSADRALARRLNATLGAEAGWTALRVVGTVLRTPRAALAGPWLGLTLGLGVAP